MTDKLKENVETAIQELKQVVDTLNASRVWRGTCWEYPPILPDQYLPLRNTIDWQVSYLRSALAEWTPDDTAYRPEGLSQEELVKISSEYLTNGLCFMKAGKHVPVDEVIDRGAWSDVEDATKWVDELRGDEPKREWISLTEEEIYPMYCEPKSDAEMIAFARELEARLREKNNG